MAFDGERLLALTREVYGEIDASVLLVSVRERGQ
jgi:hypothetical protein